MAEGGVGGSMSKKGKAANLPNRAREPESSATGQSELRREMGHLGGGERRMKGCEICLGKGKKKG